MPEADSGLPGRSATAIATEILKSDSPSWKLFDAVKELYAPATLEKCREVFEAVFWKISIDHYWVHHIMARVYTELDQPAAAFLNASLAMRLEPESESWHIYKIIFSYFVERMRYNEALSVISQQLEKFPENPVAWPQDIIKLVKHADGQIPQNLLPYLPSNPPDSRRQDHKRTRVQDESFFRLGHVGTFGKHLPYCIRPALAGLNRPAIDIVTLPNSELFVSINSVAIRDATGTVQQDLSISKFPPSLVKKISGLPETEVEKIDLDEAIVISDIHPSANLCHFLLDHVTRLAIYIQAGCSVKECTVIGPPIITNYQIAIRERLGIKRYISTDRVAKCHVRTLHISTNCLVAHRHPAHFAAPWALAFIRSLFPTPLVMQPRKLFISRSDAKTRLISNEAEVFRVLQDVGFEMITPGQMPYSEQVIAFQNATHVVGMHGAALANITFCASGTHLLEVFHPLYGTWAYAVLGVGSQLNYASLVGQDADSNEASMNDPEVTDVYKSQKDYNARNVVVDINELRRWLAASHCSPMA